jgi:hypothetical protein
MQLIAAYTLRVDKSDSVFELLTNAVDDIAATQVVRLTGAPSARLLRRSHDMRGADGSPGRSNESCPVRNTRSAEPWTTASDVWSIFTLH